MQISYSEWKIINQKNAQSTYKTFMKFISSFFIQVDKKKHNVIFLCHAFKA